MTKDDFLADLARLRTELAELDASDDETRARIIGIIDALERKLEHPDDTEHDENLLDSVRGAVEHFEVSHPRATAIVNQIMMTLGNLGI
ncbi:MAG: DUF4404 family protein [Gammaproteobacteria bacterium]|nr:DUF4404 family protein [Gammaproteobacteria bacterium]